MKVDNLHTSGLWRGLYATDASLYQQMPRAVVEPRDADEVAAVLAVARAQGAPVLARGGGTSLAGQTVAEGAIVLDFTRWMHRLFEINEEERWALVEPGLVRDELNAKLAASGLEFAPETSTSNRAALGGMIANNSSGMKSVRYGRTMEHLQGGRIMLASGEIIECRDRTPAEARELADFDTTEGRIWAKLIPIIEENRALIDERFSKVMRRVGGYSLDEFAPDAPTWNLMRLICGSEGTLALLLDAKLGLIEPPKAVGLVAIHFADMQAALKSVPAILKHGPLSVELVDDEVLRLAQQNNMTRRLAAFVEHQPNNGPGGQPGDMPAALFPTELTGETEEEVREKCDRLVADLKQQGIGYAHPVFIDAAERARVIELRKQGLGILLGMRGDLKPIPFIEDACVPVEHLAEYLSRAREACHKRGYRTALFGHASVGVVHLRPIMNMKDPAHVADLDAISHEVMLLVKEYGGSWSGEHGDGISRGAQNHEYWGEEMIDVFRQVKAVFDPDGILNPGKIFDTPELADALRYGEEYSAKPLDSKLANHENPAGSYFRFAAEQGFARAVEMCNGVGACRKTLSGTMCPSYMATREEKDSTRGRANALRLAISGQLPGASGGGIASQDIHDVLDLCLECKACKSECPSSVDMAKMKSEHLAHYYERHGTPLRSWFFAEYPAQARLLAGPLAPLANFPVQAPVLGGLLKRMLGIAPERAIPPFASETFEAWCASNQREQYDGQDEVRAGLPRGLRKVVLFNDCFTNYAEPGLGRAALALLERFGYRVEVVSGACCQRTRISKGFLKKARREGAATIDRLGYAALEGTPIVGLEPSCCSAFTDDLPDLVPNRQWAEIVGGATMPLEAFLAGELEAGRVGWPEEAHPAPGGYLVHGHCHQKSVFSTDPAKRLLGLLQNGNGFADVAEVDSGCCGMAGSFGYEDEHFEISQQIGRQRLYPAVVDAPKDRTVIANGFSCRHQIAEGTGRPAEHVVTALAKALGL